MKYYVGIDLGGTNIVAGVVDEDYNIIAKASTKTNCPRPDREIANDMAKMAVQAVKNAKLTPINKNRFFDNCIIEGKGYAKKYSHSD